MKALLLGSGGRESALASALQHSSLVDELVVAPGNPGIAAFAETISIDPEDPAAVSEIARSIRPALVVVGPEAPLVAGVADALRDDGVAVFGPNQEAARIEGSKSFAKEVMERAGVTVPEWGLFDDPTDAITFLDKLGSPYVVKADGLAAGKGVVVTEDRAEAVAAVESSLINKDFGSAGSSVVIEEFLDGPEVSLIAFCDGDTVLSCEPAQDYKRVFDGDGGPNTGGMGSYSPVPACPPDVSQSITSTVIEPVARELKSHGGFVGALYAGLVLTSDGPRVLEFNARFGDPETQALIPRLKSDFGEIAFAAANRELDGMRIEWSDDVCVSVVLASNGYPGSYEKGIEITGLDRVANMTNVSVFHAGTVRDGDRVVTAGGRVLAVSALARTFKEARSLAYKTANEIDFEGKHVRTDIALRAEQAEGQEVN